MRRQRSRTAPVEPAAEFAPDHTRLPWSGAWLVAASAACFGISLPLAKLLSRSGHDLFALATLRNLIVLCVAVVWHRWQRAEWRWPTGAQHALLIALGSVGVNLAVSLSFWSSAINTIATAEVLLYTGPFWAALLGAQFLGEQMSSRWLLGGVLALGGIALTGSGGQAPFLRWSVAGTVVGLTAGAALAANTVLARLFMVRHRFGPLNSLILALLYAAPIGLLLNPGAPVLPRTFDTLGWLAFLGLAVAQSAGTLLFMYGLASTPAGVSMLISVIDPVVAVLAAALWLDEPVGWPQAAGVLLMLSAAWLAQHVSGRPYSFPPPTKPPPDSPKRHK